MVNGLLYLTLVILFSVGMIAAALFRDWFHAVAYGAMLVFVTNAPWVLQVLT